MLIIAISHLQLRYIFPLYIYTYIYLYMHMLAKINNKLCMIDFSLSY